MSKLKVGVIIGSTREGRFAEKAAAWIFERAGKRGDLDVELIDLRDFPLPFFEDAVSPAYGPSPNKLVQAWQQKVASLDGYIITAAEYNRGPTAVLKNALDYANKEWNNKPAAFVGYGGVGATRAVEQLRLHAVELQMAPIRTAVHILLPDYIAVSSGERNLSEIEHLNKGADGMLDQFIWWAQALKAAREQTGQAAAKAA